jgi:hypothetical protein
MAVDATTVAAAVDATAVADIAVDATAVAAAVDATAVADIAVDATTVVAEHTMAETIHYW